MKPLIFFVVILFLAGQSISQIPTIKSAHFLIPKDTLEEKYVILEMPYGKSNITNTAGDTANLRIAGDIQIDIVCTDFPSTLNLSRLNNQRLSEAYKQFDYLKTKDNLVNIIRQTDGGEKQKAKEMFHGVVIRFRRPQNKETMIQDIVRLDSFISIQEKEINNSPISSNNLQKKNHRLHLKRRMIIRLSQTVHQGFIKN